MAIDNLSTGLLSNLNDLIDSYPNTFSFIQLDILDFLKNRDLLESVDIVVHLAAEVSVNVCESDMERAKTVNEVGFFNMLSAARLSNIKKFIYASSCAVYGDVGDGVCDESMTVNPLNNYGISKLMNEKLAGLCGGVGNDIECLGMRFFNVYGPYQNPNSQYSAVIPLWISSLLRDEVCTIRGDGTATRDFVHVFDVVDTIEKVGLGETKRLGQSVINVCTGRSTNLNDVYKTIAKGVEVFRSVYLPSPRYVEYSKFEIKHSKGSNKLLRKFNDKVFASVETHLNELVCFYAK